MRGKNWKLCLALAAVLLPLLAWLGRAGAGPAGKVSIFNARLGRVELVEKIRRTDREWRKLLTPKAYRVTRLKETDLPYREQCSVPAPGEVGIYQCVGCGTDLFPAGTKFESGSGWPSFQAPVSELNIRVQADRSHGRLRSEVLCARCDAHLGHVFDDGPPPAGKRYCINSTALVLFKTGRPLKRLAVATFAAGCFWGVEEAFRRVPGVVSTAVGFTGGWLKEPTYEDVCRKNTGHAEAVRLEYDPARVAYEDLLEVFWSIHDPTTPDRQGVDVGPQYRSVIFYHDARQEKAARLSAQKAARSGKFSGPIVTRIVEAGPFYRAEEYHQRYYEKRGIKPACRR